VRPRWRHALAFLAGPAIAIPATAQDSLPPLHVARITYLTSSTAYLDAGESDGLRVGSAIEVVRGGVSIAALRVSFLSPHRASCEILRVETPPVVGDSVRFRAVPTAASPSPPLTAATPAPRPKSALPGLHGRVGVQYLSIGPPPSGGGALSEPSFDLRLDGHPGGAAALDLTLDVRARRTHVILPDGTTISDGRVRVYQAALAATPPGSPAQVTVGRQISGRLASVGVFDGILAELNRSRWATGIFAGTQPEPVDLRFSTEISEWGGYLQHHSSPAADARWALTLGASGSYQSGRSNREFVYVQGTYWSRLVSALVTQEVDYYRPWKLLPGMRPVSPTATFALLRVQPSVALGFDAGFDTRRNVRLYRDVVSPATAFDDAYREGVWGGVTLRFAQRFGIGLDARSSRGGPAGPATAYTVSLNDVGLGRLGVWLRTRSTWYQGPGLRGWLHSVTAGYAPNRLVDLQVTGGVRQERNPLADPVTKVWAPWVGTDVDVNLGRSWYALVSATRQGGGFDNNNQIYVGVSLRF
jgi:hypothetical protein